MRIPVVSEVITEVCSFQQPKMQHLSFFVDILGWLSGLLNLIGCDVIMIHGNEIKGPGIECASAGGGKNVLKNTNRGWIDGDEVIRGVLMTKTVIAASANDNIE